MTSPAPLTLLIIKKLKPEAGAGGKLLIVKDVDVLVFLRFIL